MSKDTFHFRLYVAGESSNSVQAISTLQTVCEKYLKGRHKIEVVDVLRDSARALADGIFLTPTIVRITPKPQQRVIGNLSEPGIFLATLGIQNGNL